VIFSNNAGSQFLSQEGYPLNLYGLFGQADGQADYIKIALYKKLELNNALCFWRIMLRGLRYE
jgi:hypothetical protein